MSLISADHKRWLQQLLGRRVCFDEPMRRRTTFGIGGPADAYAMVADVDELTLLVRGANQRSLPWRVVGKGSNLLVRDGGIRGIVINPAPYMRAVEVEEDGAVDEIIITAQAGLSLPALCRLALANGWAGMNFALGIPGSVGGAISMNAGSAEGCIADVLKTVTLLDRQAKRITVATDKITWAYRHAGWPLDSIIVEGTVKLQAADKQQLKREARQWVMARKRRQPAEPSAGCFFKNPSPHNPAGRLIDQAGLKGQRLGKAAVSRRHANFIVNLGGASAGDVLTLVRLIQTTVADRFGIALEPEVVILGEEGYAQESL